MTDGRDTLIFDVDGTLVDSTYQHALAWQRAFRECAIVVPTWRVHRAIGMGGDRLVGEVCGDVVEARLGDKLRERHAEAYHEMANSVAVLPGVRELLDKAHGEGFRICVASSGSRRDTDRSLDLVDMGGVWDTVVTGDDVESSKPAPDVVGLCWERSGRGPATMVGDTVYDVEAAGRLDLPCVTVRTGGFGAAELTDAGAALVVDELTALAQDRWSTLQGLQASRADERRAG